MEVNSTPPVQDIESANAPDCCGNCWCFAALQPAKFQVQHEGKSLTIDGYNGQCRFNPPTAVVVVKQQMADLRNPQGGLAQHVEAHFPPVSSIGWCSQHRLVEKPYKE